MSSVGYSLENVSMVVLAESWKGFSLLTFVFYLVDE